MGAGGAKSAAHLPVIRARGLISGLFYWFERRRGASEFQGHIVGEMALVVGDEDELEIPQRRRRRSL